MKPIKMKDLLKESTKEHDLRELERAEKLLKQVSDVLYELTRSTKNRRLEEDVSGNLVYIINGELDNYLRKCKEIAKAG